MKGYEALRQAAAWLDLVGRTVFTVRGEDRVRWLHAMVTNHVARLEPGQGCYAFLLNAQGRILADANILCLRDQFLLDLEPEVREGAFAHLDRHIIADDVVLEDRSGRLCVIAVEGPQSAEALGKMGLPLPQTEFAHEEREPFRVARVSATGLPGFRIFAPVAMRDVLLARIAQAGVPEADGEAVRTVRLEQGRPRYGEDITDQRLPQETQLLHAVHFTKGCYIGQEIVERIRARGQVHRLLVRLLLEGTEPPSPGARVSSGGQEVGEITSAAFSPALAQVVALAYLRREALEAGGALSVAGRTVRLMPEPPI
jgi:aminomethyltransferase